MVYNTQRFLILLQTMTEHKQKYRSVNADTIADFLGPPSVETTPLYIWTNAEWPQRRAKRAPLSLPMIRICVKLKVKI